MFPITDQGFFSWIIAIFKVRDELILKRSGPDAIQYLSFQRYVIVYLMLITVVSLVVVLPINYQGTLKGDANDFGQTTISNLSPSSPVLWVHILLSIILFPLGVYCMRHFSVNLKFEENPAVSRTLMITDIPKEKCTKDRIVNHFQESYGGKVLVQDIQLAYNIKELMRLDKRREVMHDAKVWSESYREEKGQSLIITPCRCSWILTCCCGKCESNKIDASDYYTRRENEFKERVEYEKGVSMHKPLGICFITFQTAKMAHIVYTDHQHTCKCGFNPPMPHSSVDLEPYRWEVSNAPVPQDIYWENLCSNSEHWYLKAFCINFCIFFILFFVTTPFVIISSLNLPDIFSFVNKVHPVIGRFLPTLLLWTVAALLPVIVSYSDQFVRHWTRSAENHTIMRKTFVFLLFMIVILPSLGLTSAKAFVEWAFSEGGRMRWDCVFLPDNGAFYINYVITSAFVGTSLELIRFPELFMYVVRLSLVRSIAERIGVRKAILWEFPFGTQYAWFLLVFAITVIYSISCPLITPCGLVYMCFKHCVDRHNIIFAYGPSKISKHIHGTAINFVVVSLLLLQMMLMFFSIIRRGLNGVTIFSLVFFCICSLIFMGQLFFNLFKGFSPILYTRFKGEEVIAEEAEEPIPRSPMHVQFLPNVLNRTRNRENFSDTDVTSPRKCYGTNEEQADVDVEVLLRASNQGSDVVNSGYLYQDYREKSDNVNVKIDEDLTGDSDEIVQTKRLEEHNVIKSTSDDPRPHPI
ncbi:hypothetical protein CHUAL_003319 [Chamberlinius hualienensis]